MPQGDWYILIIVGGVFIILGIAGIIWGVREEKRIFDALSKKPDLREFSLKRPGDFFSHTCLIGGWIAIGLGLLMVIVGIIFWRTGWPPA